MINNPNPCARDFFSCKMWYGILKDYPLKITAFRNIVSIFEAKVSVTNY
ncbi:hypothetical protein JOE44_000961 [Chryseobacterium sp. PvR013]|nr:hypothetical protein [Chryseobacterium sp. PvR013]